MCPTAPLRHIAPSSECDRMRALDAVPGKLKVDTFAVREARVGPVPDV